MLQTLLLRLRNRVKQIGNNHKVILGKNVRIRKCQISIHGHNNQLHFQDGANLKGVIIEIDGDNCSIIIGKNCVIGENCYLSSRERNTHLKIGDQCMFSRNVKVMTSDGHDIYVNEERVNPARSITIGNRVWLADNAVVLKGVEVGDNSIVGINAVVTKTVDKNMIAVGNPAKTVKSNITWDERLTY